MVCWVSLYVALEKALPNGTSLLNFGYLTPQIGALVLLWRLVRMDPRIQTQPRGSGWDSPPLPLPTYPTFCLKQAVPRTELLRSARRAAPRPGARRAAPRPHLRGPGEGGGAAAGGRGAFVFLTHLSRQLVWGSGQGALWAGCVTHHAPPPPLTTSPLPGHPELWGWGGGAVKLQGHSPLPLGLRFQDSSSYLPRNLILGVGGPKGFCLTPSSLGTPGLT